MIDDYQWVIGDEQLAQCVAIWSKAPVIALDTEFIRTETFYPQLGLIQVGIGQQTWLIDPLTITKWRPFADLLTNEQVVKVLHALSEDVEVLQCTVGCNIASVIDTQVAASLLGYPQQMSYAKLIGELCDQEIAKEVTRSDWLKRPLDPVQCQYAAADVYWLYKAFFHLKEKLDNLGRYDWAQEDSQRQAVTSNVNPTQYYKKLRGGWKLKGARLLTLQLLAQWREELARSQDVNRGRILKDKEMLVIAEKMPTRTAQLQQDVKLGSRTIRLYGSSILSFVEHANNARKEAWPELIDGPLPADQADIYQQIKTKINDIAEQNDIPVDTLARRKLLEAWVRSGCRTGHYNIPEFFTGWRKAYLVEPISTILNKQWQEVDHA
ncbi:ribonuclease D [Reinekea forsetii]|nr:ribonuclease D [Reinekea forsetii]